MTKFGGYTAYLVLEDGSVFGGFGFGASGETSGEVCFNTSMTGYQEILTDPSYHGQMVCMTYPLIGNYGVNRADVESVKPQVRGFIIRELSRIPSNYRSEQRLETYLAEAGIVGIEGIDTRALTRKLRQGGSMMGLLSTVDLDPDHLLRKLREAPPYVGADLVREVTTPAAYVWQGDATVVPARGANGDSARQMSLFDEPEPEAGTPARFNVVCLDCGVKFNSLRELTARGCRTTVLPAAATVDDILRVEADGVYLSNGPGDPEAVTYVHETVRGLMARGIPLFGICLGHQMLAWASGGRTYKMKFGHRGGNQPVMDLETGHVEITSQNHGFAVDPDSLAGTGLKVTHINLNDQTIEGMRHETLPVFSVQYHPEASPGPHDANYLFDRFLDAMARRQAG